MDKGEKLLTENERKEKNLIETRKRELGIKEEYCRKKNLNNEEEKERKKEEESRKN